MQKREQNVNFVKGTGKKDCDLWVKSITIIMCDEIVGRSMSKFFVLSVDGSIRRKKPEYFFIYKGVKYRYISRRDVADTLIAEMGTETDKGVFLNATELFSIISFYRNAKYIISPG